MRRHRFPPSIVWKLRDERRRAAPRPSAAAPCRPAPAWTGRGGVAFRNAAACKAEFRPKGGSAEPDAASVGGSVSAMDIVVLGGSGFVGRHLVAHLVAAAHRVFVPTRSRERAKHLILLPTVEVIEADIHDPPTLSRLIRDADAVVDLVGILHEKGHGGFERVHVELPRKLVAACRERGVPRLLHMSALNADPAGPSRYLRSKGEAEAIVASSSLAWTIFRPSVIFGREDSFLNMFAKLERLLPIIALASPDARFQPVYVGDVAGAYLCALEDDRTHGQRYELCGPSVYTLRELVAYVGQVTR